MDLAVLLSTPAVAILTAIALVAVSAWIGFSTGRNTENKRKELAIAQAGEAATIALDELRKENKEKLDVLNKAGTNELEKLKQVHTRQLDQLSQAHLALVESLKSTHLREIERLSTEHSGLIDRLNASNNAHISDLENRRQEALQAIKDESSAALSELNGEHQQILQALCKDHDQAVLTLQDDHGRRLQDLEQRNQQEVARLSDQVSALQQERDRRNAAIVQLEETVTALRSEIKDAKLNDRFSVSKSGEKLIRVVRTVQELASELDETSRTVTGGEYSFFDQIKHQRDRDTVLSLTGSSRSYPSDQTDEPPPVGSDAPGEPPVSNLKTWLGTQDDGEASDQSKASH